MQPVREIDIRGGANIGGCEPAAKLLSASEFSITRLRVNQT